MVLLTNLLKNINGIELFLLSLGAMAFEKFSYRYMCLMIYYMCHIV